MMSWCERSLYQFASNTKHLQESGVLESSILVTILLKFEYSRPNRFVVFIANDRNF